MTLKDRIAEYIRREMLIEKIDKDVLDQLEKVVADEVEKAISDIIQKKISFASLRRIIEKKRKESAGENG